MADANQPPSPASPAQDRINRCESCGPVTVPVYRHRGTDWCAACFDAEGWPLPQPAPSPSAGTPPAPDVRDGLDPCGWPDCGCPEEDAWPFCGRTVRLTTAQAIAALRAPAEAPQERQALERASAILGDFDRDLGDRVDAAYSVIEAAIRASMERRRPQPAEAPPAATEQREAHETLVFDVENAFRDLVKAMRAPREGYDPMPWVATALAHCKHALDALEQQAKARAALAATAQEDTK